MVHHTNIVDHALLDKSIVEHALYKSWPKVSKNAGSIIDALIITIFVCAAIAGLVVLCSTYGGDFQKLVMRNRICARMIYLWPITLLAGAFVFSCGISMSVMIAAHAIIILKSIVHYLCYKKLPPTPEPGTELQQFV